MYKQRGVTMITVVLGLCLGAFLALAGMRLVPMYLNFAHVQEIVNSIKDEQENNAKKRGIAELKDTWQKRLKINSLYDDMYKNALEIKKEGNSYVLDVYYEDTEPFVYNVYFLIPFEMKVTIPKS